MCAKGWVHRLLRDPGSTATGCVSAWLGIYPFFILCVPRRYEECVSAIRTVNYISGSSQGGGMSSPDGVNPIRNRSFCSAEEMTCLPLTNKKEILVTLQGVHLMGWRSCYERYQSHRYVARSSYWTAYLRRTRAELLHRFWVRVEFLLSLACAHIPLQAWFDVKVRAVLLLIQSALQTSAVSWKASPKWVQGSRPATKPSACLSPLQLGWTLLVLRWLPHINSLILQR